MNERMEKLRESLGKDNIQGMIVSNPASIKYLINLDAEGVLLLTRKNDIFITDGRYIEEVNSSLTLEDEITVHNYKDLTLDDYENFFMFCENVGFEEKYVTYEMYKRILQKYKCNNLVETEGIIEKLRVVKKEEEIEKIKKACEITDKCFSHLLKYIKVGMTEIEIAMEIEKFFIENGGDGVAFPTIVASGSNSAKPHAVPSNRKIEVKDIILIDMGCKFEGYCSDMSRTIFVGEIPNHIKRIYDYVLKNQQIVLREIREGRTVKDIAKVSECDFEMQGFTLIHALGHGVGLETHEIPVIGPKNESVLKSNTVLAIEPGIYVYGRFGIRIEDTILVGKDGCINLTKSGKDYTII